jgi:hypothetical protein
LIYSDSFSAYPVFDNSFMFVFFSNHKSSYIMQVQEWNMSSFTNFNELSCFICSIRKNDLFQRSRESKIMNGVKKTMEMIFLLSINGREFVSKVVHTPLLARIPMRNPWMCAQHVTIVVPNNALNSLKREPSTIRAITWFQNIQSSISDITQVNIKKTKTNNYKNNSLHRIAKNEEKPLELQTELSHLRIQYPTTRLIPRKWNKYK